MLHHEQTISGEEMYTLITFMLSVMASNKKWMAYKLIYNPLIDYIRSHVRLCTIQLYSSKASSLCYTVNSEVVAIVWHACKPNLYVYSHIYIYDGIKGGSAVVMQAM